MSYGYVVSCPRWKNKKLCGFVGTAEVCLVGVQSDFPARIIHREQYCHALTVLHSHQVRDSTKSYSYCGGKRRNFMDAQRQSLAVRSSNHTSQEDAGPTSSTPAKKTGAHGLEVDRFSVWSFFET